MKRRTWGLLGGAVAIAGAATAVSIILLTGGGKPKAVAAGSPPAKTLQSALQQHPFLTPECAPVHGKVWVFPGPTRIRSDLYEMFAIKYPCRLAAQWTKRLSSKVIPVSKTGDNIQIKGPAGFDCGAWADNNGHAYAGGCQDGDRAFAWNWNVANPRVTPTRDADGHVRLTKTYGSDDLTVVRPLKRRGQYQLYVENTSGIGFIDAFTWHPPPGWTIKAISDTRGAACSLTAAGSIRCSGSVRPPSCLCTGDGGNVTIKLSVLTKRNTKTHTYGAVGAKLQLDRMTPVPFLIPGTPKEAKRAAQHRGE